MSKVVSRLLIFFIGVPVVIAIALWPFCNHIALHILIILASILGANELYNLFKAKVSLLPKPLVICCTAFLPLIAAVTAIFPDYIPSILTRSGDIITTSFVFAILLLLLVEVIFTKEFEKSIQRISASSFIVLYVGYLISFISKMTTISGAGQEYLSCIYIAVFLLMVFMCDSLAWLFGVLLGKNNRGLIKASPNKSIAGFIGGFAGSIGIGVIVYYLYPNFFPGTDAGSIAKIILLGLATAFSSIVGDLAESVIKRSAGAKDSGRLIPGRGGLLDSIDSILMSAPVYYVLITHFYSL
ncbi:MAG: phosphatidate cytidylyltransferase [Treponema sp.]|nr:phosphatidate cytidylyltransferase [Treponema sp.]